MKYLSGIGLSVKDENVLKSLTDVLGARTSEEWLYRDDDLADVLLLDCDNPEAVRRWKTSPPELRQRTIAYSSKQPPFVIEQWLSKPLRADRLIAVLNAMAESAG